jgi:hypothetical protein
MLEETMLLLSHRHKIALLPSEQGASMTKDEALRLAWEALSYINEGANNQGAHTGISWRCAANKSAEALNAIKAALEAKDEPVAWLHTKIEGVAVPHRPSDLNKHPERWEALYKTPQRTWVGLTDEEQLELYKKHSMDGWGLFYNAIEAKLKEKNHASP